MSRVAFPSLHRLAAEPLCGIVLVDASSMLTVPQSRSSWILAVAFGRLADSLSDAGGCVNAEGSGGLGGFPYFWVLEFTVFAGRWLVRI